MASENPGSWCGRDFERELLMSEAKGMKRRFWGAAVSAVLAAVSVACARPDDTIKVGYYGSMTGKEATFGQSTYNGVKIALDEINKAGGLNGKKLEVIPYDDKGDSKE